MRLPTAEPRSTACVLFPLSVALWNDLADPVFDGVGAGSTPFCWPSCSHLFCFQLFSLSLLFLYRLIVWGWGLRTDRVAISLSRPCIANLFYNNNTNNNNDEQALLFGLIEQAGTRGRYEQASTSRSDEKARMSRPARADPHEQAGMSRPARADCSIKAVSNIPNLKSEVITPPEYRIMIA